MTIEDAVAQFLERYKQFTLSPAFIHADWQQSFDQVHKMIMQLRKDVESK